MNGIKQKKKNDWKLKKLKEKPKNGYKVFSCFSCGGGSTMGYKLAGYDVIGNLEIDPEMMKIYKKNHKPRYPYLMDIRKFNKLDDDEIPEQLFDLEILDGSPPCSTFSIAGNRDKDWGRKKKFREGQVEQELDDLFFDYLDTAEKLKPKVILAENVKGLVQGKAKGFVKLIKKKFNRIGYDVQLFLLNSATMGVPQKRQRVFFIAHKKEYNLPRLKLKFNEKPIVYKEIKSGRGKKLKKKNKDYKLWKKRKVTDKSFSEIAQREEGKSSYFNYIFLKENKVPNTITSGGGYYRMNEPYKISNQDIIRISTFPIDYNFLDTGVQYVCGMSVPPKMIEKIAKEIEKQWLNKINNK